MAEWNAAFPSCAVEPGDRVVSVNGAQHPELAARSVLESGCLFFPLWCPKIGVMGGRREGGGGRGP